MIDWTISVSSIIQVAAFVIVWVGLYFQIRNDINAIRHDLAHIEARQSQLNDAFTQLGSILTQVAVQDNRLHMVERSIDELRHGQGFINPPKVSKE